jgi:cobalamin biosynthetic protein CobC
MLHGGDLTDAMARFGGGPEDWLDLSTGINPHAYPLPQMPARVWRALPSAGDLDALLAAARRAYRVPEDVGLAAAPGTQALIQLLPRLLPPGDVAILGPTYAEHAISARAAGRAVREIDDLSSWRGDEHLILVNPNNPDGRLTPPDAVAGLARTAHANGRWIVSDESFMDVAPDETAVDHCGARPVAILRSFGKFYGLAGVRLGFLAAGGGLAEAAARALGPWAVPGPALAIGQAALADGAWSDATRERLAEEAAALDDALIGRGFAIVGGAPLFRLARRTDAAAVHAGLAARRIWTRRFAWDAELLRFGLPGGQERLARLADALREIG